MFPHKKHNAARRDREILNKKGNLKLVGNAYHLCVCIEVWEGVNKRGFLNVKKKIVVLGNANKQGWLNFVLIKANRRHLIITKFGVKDFTERRQWERVV